MYKLTIEVRKKTKARLIGFPIRQYVFGQPFEVYYVIKNIGDQPSPPGRFTVIINWQGTQYKEEKTYQVPRLKPDQSHPTKPEEWGVLSHLGGFHIIDVVSAEHPQFKLHSTEGIEIGIERVIDAVFGMPPEGVYEYWALWVATGGFIILVGEKLWRLLNLLN